MSIELEDFFMQMSRGDVVEGNSELHHFMCNLSYEAMRLTAKLNNGYHEPEEIRELFSQIIGKPVDDSFTMFPPFYTDCGKNITVGKNVFINAGCHFQDQGGIIIGDGVQIGHNVTLATLNHDLDPAKRANTHPAPIIIGKQVWLGSMLRLFLG